MGLVLPGDGFLSKLRKTTGDFGACLIFDEVITAFRFGPSTYGRICGITPDLTCLGKIIGGGMPIGAVAGPAAIMDMLAPAGPVYQAGTLSGNPVSMAAGIATLKILLTLKPYERLAELGLLMAKGLESIQTTRHDFELTSLGSTFTVFFAAGKVTDYATAKLCDTSRYAEFFHHMLNSGIFLPPSQFETCFISTAHSENDIAAFLSAFHEYPRHFSTDR